VPQIIAQPQKQLRGTLAIDPELDAAQCRLTQSTLQ
jgi:hypothetical protein